VNRERFEEFTKYNFLGQIMAVAQRVPYDLFKRAQESLRLAIFQTAYDPEAVRERLEEVRRVTEEEREERLRDARLLASVERMTAKDEEEESKQNADAFTSSLSRRNRVPTSTKISSKIPEGVRDPWKPKE
jgi:glycyl-tRNA synthetase (class II)